MKDPMTANLIDAICNRHIARILTDLEEANCPAIFRDAVKSKLQWLRSDLKGMKPNDRAHDYPEIEDRRNPS